MVLIITFILLSNISSRHRAIFVSVVMGWGQCYAWRNHFLYEKSWRHQCWSHHVSRASEIIWGLEEASLRFWRHIIHLSSTASLRGPKMIVLELRNCSAFPCFRPFVQVEISWIFQAVKVSFYPNLSGVRSQIFLYCSQMLWTIKWILEFFIGFIKFLLLSEDMLILITSRFCQMIHPIFLPPLQNDRLLTTYLLNTFRKTLISWTTKS